VKKILAMSAIKLLGVQLIELALEEYIYPKAEEYVKKTDNSYDDALLSRFKAFMRDVLSDFK